MKYVGIDGCKGGWFFAAIGERGDYQFGTLKQFSEVSRLLDSAELILVDIPIGLPSSGPDERLCDKEARRMISPRGSSVFPAPARSALDKGSYQEGSEENFRKLGRRLSKQSWAIGPKIREVDSYMRFEKVGTKIREMHPEVAYCALNQGQALQHRKKKPEGAKERLRILENHWPRTREFLCEAMIEHLGGGVEIDDILDALSGAVTASKSPRLATLPSDPPTDDEGLPMEMVFWSGAAKAY